MMPVRMLSKSWAIRPAITAASPSRWFSRSGSMTGPIAATTAGDRSIIFAVSARYARSWSVHGCPATWSAHSSPSGRPAGMTGANTRPELLATE